MGLFDGYFDQQNFGPADGGGGLLAALMRLQQGDTNSMDGAQWPSGPMGAPRPGLDEFMIGHQSQMPAPGAQPSPLDNAQWPFGPMGSPNAELPPNSMPTQGMLPPGGMPPQQQQPPAGPGFGDRLTAGLSGFANSGGPLPAIANLIGGLATGQRSDPQGMRQQQQQATMRALIASGVPEAQAQAAALNPEVLKAIAPGYFAKPTFGVIGESPIGKDYGFIDTNKGTVTRPGDAGGSTGGNSTGMALLAPGVRQMDPSLSGEAYLNQFGPEVKAAVKAYMSGDVMPTGNPRLTGIANFAKTIAQKYGQDMGIPVSDATYSERRTYRSGLGSNSPSSPGGQAKAFVQGIEHATKLAETLQKLDNSNGLGIPILAEGINAVRQAASNDQQALADKAQGIGQTLAGEVGKLFSGSAGGGVHEREMTRSRFSTIRSKPQLAAALEATLETMEGGLTALENRRDQVLGPHSGVELVPQETRAQIDGLRRVIAELKGTAPALAGQTAAPASGGAKPIASKAEYDQLPPGSPYTAPDGSQRTKR